MFKNMSIIMLTLILIASLCSCSGSEKIDDSAISSAQDAQSETHTVNLSPETIVSDIKKDAKASIENYSKEIYEITGYVSEISDSYVRIIPLNAPVNSQTVVNEACIDAYIPKEEISSISQYDMITVYGKITNITDGVTVNIEMKDASFKSDVIEVSGNVEGFILNEDNYYEIRICEKIPGISKGYYAYYNYPVKKSDGTQIQEAKIGEKTYRIGDSITLKSRLKYKHKTYNSPTNEIECNHYLEIKEVVSFWTQTNFKILKKFSKKVLTKEKLYAIIKL